MMQEFKSIGEIDLTEGIKLTNLKEGTLEDPSSPSLSAQHNSNCLSSPCHHILTHTSGRSLLSRQRPGQHPEPQARQPPPLLRSPSITLTVLPLFITSLVEGSLLPHQRLCQLPENQVSHTHTPTLSAPTQHFPKCHSSPCHLISTHASDRSLLLHTPLEARPVS